MRLALLLVVLLAPPAAAACPELLYETLTGWVPPPVCAGQGRYNTLSAREVRHERSLFQRTGFADDILECWRTTPGATTCLLTATDRYRRRETASLAGGGPPACLTLESAEGDRLELEQWLLTTAYPVLYCAVSNAQSQKNVSAALGTLFHHLGRVHLERAINEIKVGGFLAAENAVMANYEMSVSRMGTGPACLTQAAALELGQITRSWMALNSHRAFCATVEGD